jgi:hypothetical protein
MEGVLYLKNGVLKRWNKYFTILDDETLMITVLKKSFKGKVALTISLEPDVHGQVNLKVFPMS